MDRALLAVTMGDPAGVGPEIVLKALRHTDVYRRCRPLVLGDRRILERAATWVGSPGLEFDGVDDPAAGRYTPGAITLLDLTNASPGECPTGRVSAAAGRAAVEYVFRACDLALAGTADAVVTAPLNKAAMNLAGFAYAGHTELLAGLARALADALPPLPLAPRPQLSGPRSAGLPLRRRPRGAALVVAGSRHPRTARQVESARRRGAEVVRPSPAFLNGDDRAVGAAIQAVTGRLAGGHDAILTTAGMGEGAQGEKTVAAQLGRVVRAVAPGGQVGGLVLTGGDTAAAVCAALAATTLWLRGEVQPGIAWGLLLDGALPGLPVVTKAGGFGSDDVLEVALHHLHLLAK